MSKKIVDVKGEMFLPEGVLKVSVVLVVSVKVRAAVVVFIVPVEAIAVGPVVCVCDKTFFVMFWRSPRKSCNLWGFRWRESGNQGM